MVIKGDSWALAEVCALLNALLDVSLETYGQPKSMDHVTTADNTVVTLVVTDLEREGGAELSYEQPLKLEIVKNALVKL